MKILVFGAGALGSLIGGLLAREHRVTLVGREPHVNEVRDSGLAVEGAFDFTTYPDARTEVPDSTDLALVTVKSFDTSRAVRTLVDCDLDVVCSLQNGLGNEERLASRFDCVLAGTCTYGARLTSSGGVECTGVGEVTLGLPAGGRSGIVDRVAHTFERAGIETTVAADMPRRLWEKLAVNTAINPTTALARVPNGVLADGPLHEVAYEAARETVSVACEHGIALDEGSTLTALDTVIETTAANTSSMLQDVQRETRTEIDAINGAVVERATEPVPVNRTLTALLRATERRG